MKCAFRRIRLLLYCCDFEVEGLCTGFGHGHYTKTRPERVGWDKQAVHLVGLWSLAEVARNVSRS